MKQRILYYTVMCQSRWSSINRFRVHPSFIYTILSWLLYNILYSFSCVISKDGQSWRISWTKSPLRTVLLLGLPLDSEILNKKGSISGFPHRLFMQPFDCIFSIGTPELPLLPLLLRAGLPSEHRSHGNKLCTSQHHNWCILQFWQNEDLHKNCIPE